MRDLFFLHPLLPLNPLKGTLFSTKQKAHRILEAMSFFVLIQSEVPFRRFRGKTDRANSLISLLFLPPSIPLHILKIRLDLGFDDEV